MGEPIRELEGMRFKGGTVAGAVEKQEERSDDGGAAPDDESE
jgi:hypothetical protein